MSVKQTSPQAFDDIDLMQYVDDELDDATVDAVTAYLESSEGEAACHKVTSLQQMGDVLSSYLELEADAAEPELDAMWEAIERRVQAAGSEKTRERPKKREQQHESGIWANIVRFFEGYRGHIFTGAIAAGAAAVIILALLPPKEVVVERKVAVQDQRVRTPDSMAPNQVTPQPIVPQPDIKFIKGEPTSPEIEELEVNGGSGTVFMMPSEGEGDVSATVIFVDFNDVEGPL